MVLSLAYIVAAIIPFVMKGAFRVWPMVIGHLLYLTYFLYSYKQLDAENVNSVKKFYKSIWNLFYLEYVLYPFI